jgi:hypothetical protein
MITATNTACQPKTFFEGAMPNASLYEVKKKKDSEKSFSQPGPVPRH